MKPAASFGLLLKGGMEISRNQQERQECIRCGECCKRGGPALHEADFQRVSSGDIPLSALYTIRPGERAYDNIGGGLCQVDQDIVKIKSRGDSPACLFYDDSEKACLIYEKRPLECRLQACWDNSALEKAYASRRLSRRMILQNADWLMEMIDAYEEKCHFRIIHDLVDRREAGVEGAADALTEVVNYDAYFRDIAVNKGRVPREILDFLFGRPLADVLKQQFGVKVVRR